MPNWKKVITSGSDAVLTSVTATAGFTGSLLGTASFATTASYVSSNFQYEIHVSQIDGNDTTGNGDLLKPVATIGKALLIVSASVASTDRRTIIVHPGTYIENITVNTTNTYFFSTGLLGANCLISGSVTVSAATRMSGLKMTNLIVSSSAPVYINNCAVDKQMTVSGSGYLEVQNTSLQCTSGIQVVGPASSGVIFENCSLYPLTVNNASAAVYIISCNQAITPTLTAGALTITRSTISSLTSGATSTALTTAAGSVLVLESCNVYNSLLTSHAAITANGFYSIKNIIYNRSASTLASLSGTGGPLATVSQFQYINADNINSTQGLTVTGSITVSGSVINNLTASYAISASQAVSASFSTTASYATQALSASYAPGGGAAFPYTGSAEITGSLGVTGSFSVLDSIDGTNKILIGSGPIPGSTEDSVNWDGRMLVDSNGNFSVRWGALRTMYDSSAVSSLDWQNRIVIDTGTKTSIDWQNRTTIDTGTKTSIDWQNRQLKDSSGNGNLNWSSGVSITGSAVVSGSLTVTGSLLITGSSTLINQGPTILSGSFKVQGEGTGFTGPFRAIEIDDANFSRNLYDLTAGSSSIDFGNRSLNSATGQPVISWDGQTGIYDTYLYNSQIIDSATRGNLYGFNSKAGQFLGDSYFDATVSSNELVYLNTDGQWYQVDQTTNTSTKMLGIAIDIFSQTGSVLIEGDIVVGGGGGYPNVNGPNYGLPVYIREGGGTLMSTTIPTTGYVRLLGYCYTSYNGGVDWIMKFRPSNEWIEL